MLICEDCGWSGWPDTLSDKTKEGHGALWSKRTFCPNCGGGDFKLDPTVCVTAHPEGGGNLYSVRIPEYEGWGVGVRVKGPGYEIAAERAVEMLVDSRGPEFDGKTVVAQVEHRGKIRTYAVGVELELNYNARQIASSNGNPLKRDDVPPAAEEVEDEHMAEEVREQLEACNAGEKLWKNEGTFLSASDARRITEDFINEIMKEVLVGVRDVAAYGKCEFVYDPPIKLIEAVEYKLLEKLRALGYSVKRLGKVGESRCAYMLNWEK
jgi:hypothetical protein